jgi:hypothetical protein
MKLLPVASLIALSTLTMSAQTTQGPRIFSGSNTSQIVSVKQNGSGLGLKATTPSKSAIFAQSPGTTGGPAIVGRATALSSNPTVGIRGEVAACPTTSCPEGQTVGVAGFSPRAVGGMGVLGSSPMAGVVGFASGAPQGNPDSATGVSGFGMGGNGIGVFGGVSAVSATAGVFRNDKGGNLLTGNVDGAHPVFRVDGNGKVFANGGFQTGGADFAESFAIRGDRADYGPGDVLAVDPTGDRRLALANEAYSTSIAGIYSTKPGILASPNDTQSAALKEEIPLAVVGVVPCKVTTENGPIKPGDLLVASSTPGHAMKGTDRSRLTGAVVGKALQPLTSGKGTIQALVSLH